MTESPWFNDAWSHRMPLTIRRNGGGGAEHLPVCLELDAVQPVAEGLMRQDGADLRVVIAGQEVPCQMGAFNTCARRVWFELPPGAGNDAWLYYGNPTADSQHDGAGWGELRADERTIVLENADLRCVYDTWEVVDGQWETTIRQFIDRRTGVDHCNASVNEGARIDAAAGRCSRTVRTSVTADGPVFKTVHVVWPGEHPEEGLLWPEEFPEEEVEWPGAHPKIQDVTIFRRGPFVRIDYVHMAVNIVDLDTTPGGPGEKARQWFHGAEGWTREYTEYPNSYYNRYPEDGYNDPEDAGSLNCNGHFIMASISDGIGAGWGRVAPVDGISIIKPLWNGYELFSWLGGGKHRQTHRVYAFGDGEAGADAVGMALADPPVIAAGLPQDQ